MFSFIHTYRVSHRTFPVVFFMDSFGKPQDIELKCCIGIFQTFRPCGLVWPYLTLYGLIWLHMVLLFFIAMAIRLSIALLYSNETPTDNMDLTARMRKCFMTEMF